MSGNKIKVDLDKFEGRRMYERFLVEPSPSVCVTGRFDITNLFKIKKKGHSLNALLCYCIMQTAQKIKAFHYSIKEDGLYYYENVKTNAVIIGKDGQHYYVDYKYYDNFVDFEKEYKRVNSYCSENCVHLQEDTGALIATSTILSYPFTSVSIDISTTFWDNFVIWGKFQKKGFKKILDISMRFHHATIDGQAAGNYFALLQKNIKELRIK